MGTDLVVPIARSLLVEALLLAAPILVAAAAVSLVVSLLQTLTGVQEQTLTAVPRLLVVFSVTLLALPWMAHRMVDYTHRLWTDLHRYLG